MIPKVLILIDSLVMSGPVRGILQVVRHTAPNDCQITLAVLRYPGRQSPELIQALQESKANLIFLEQRFAFDPTVILQLARIVKKESYTVIESHGYKTHLIAAGVKALTKVPWIAFSHGWTAENFKTRLYHSLDYFTLRFADEFVVLTAAMRTILEKTLGRPGRIHLILNGIEEHAPSIPAGSGTRSRVRADLGIPEESILIGCFGRLSSEKGQGILLEALAGLRTERTWRLLILGDGVDARALREKAALLRLSDNVIFAGHTNEIEPFYKAIDLLVVPSLSEGLPNVILEAHREGVPVIASAVGSVSESIEHGVTGWLVPPHSPGALTSTLETCLEKSAVLKVAGVAAKNSLFPRFSAATRARSIKELYLKLSRNS
jgi:glycosyltransferase involved in cell wall biosynthesis